LEPSQGPGAGRLALLAAQPVTRQLRGAEFLGGHRVFTFSVPALFYPVFYIMIFYIMLFYAG